jgi:hypothetical protein
VLGVKVGLVERPWSTEWRGYSASSLVWVTINFNIAFFCNQEIDAGHMGQSVVQEDRKLLLSREGYFPTLFL